MTLLFLTAMLSASALVAGAAAQIQTPAPPAPEEDQNGISLTPPSATDLLPFLDDQKTLRKKAGRE